MTRLVGSVLASLFLASLHGCRQTVPTYTVCLVDVSKSITSVGYQSEFKAVEEIVDSMHRGDRLTIIPITGNAAADTPGAVVTVTAPVLRQAYDGDLSVFRKEAHREIAVLRDKYSAEKATQTDILGALVVAQEELEAESGEPNTSELRRFLFVFSDFIEDDRTLHFAHAQKEAAVDLASRLRQEHQLSLPLSTTVRFIKLQSSDAQALHSDMQEWIRAFWPAYLLPAQVQWTPLEAVTVRLQN